MKSFQDRGKISWRAWKAIDVEHMLAIKGRDVNSKREGDSSPGTIVLFGVVGGGRVVLYEHTCRTYDRSFWLDSVD